MPNGPLLLGVTATADRADGIGLEQVFEQIVFSRDLLWGISTGYLCNLRAIQVRLGLSLDQVHVRAGDYVASELEDALRLAHAPEYAVRAYTMHAAGRRTLAFTAGVALAYETAEAFSEAGYTAEALDGTTEIEERRQRLARFASGETQILINCGVLVEGYDQPAVDCIILARPTRSRPLFTQMVGRGTRPFPGKRDCLLIDLTTATQTHDLISVPSLVGATPDETSDEGTFDVLAFVESEREKAAQIATEGRLIAQAVNLFARHCLHWVRIDARRFILALGDGCLVLSTTNGSTWQADYVRRDRSRETIASNLPLTYCQGTAEDFARRQGAGRLVAREARWRLAPATPKQLDALRKWRIAAPANCTKGTASDLLAAAIARSA